MSKDRTFTLRVTDEWAAVLAEAAKRLSRGPVKYSASVVIHMAVLDWLEQAEGMADLHERLVEDA